MAARAFYEDTVTNELTRWQRVKDCAMENPWKTTAAGIFGSITLFGTVTGIGLFAINEWVKSVDRSTALIIEFVGIGVGALMGILGSIVFILHNTDPVRGIDYASIRPIR